MQVLRLMRQLENLRTGDLITEFCDLFVVNPFDRWATCALTAIQTGRAANGPAAIGKSFQTQNNRDKPFIIKVNQACTFCSNPN